MHGRNGRRGSPGPTVLAILLTVGAVAACVLALWRRHWIDAAVYGVLAAAFLAWLARRRRARHGEPPHPV